MLFVFQKILFIILALSILTLSIILFFYYVLTGDFEIYFISPIFQLVDIDTKPLFEKKSLHPS